MCSADAWKRQQSLGALALCALLMAHFCAQCLACTWLSKQVAHQVTHHVLCAAVKGFDLSTEPEQTLNGFTIYSVAHLFIYIYTQHLSIQSINQFII